MVASESLENVPKPLTIEVSQRCKPGRVRFIAWSHRIQISGLIVAARLPCHEQCATVSSQHRNSSFENGNPGGVGQGFDVEMCAKVLNAAETGGHFERPRDIVQDVEPGFSAHESDLPPVESNMGDELGVRIEQNLRPVV